MKKDTFAFAEFTDKSSLTLASDSVQNKRGQAAEVVNFKRRFTELCCYCFSSFLLGMGEGAMEAGRQKKRDRRTDACFSSSSFNRSGATSAYTRQLSSSRELSPLAVHRTSYRFTFSSKMGGGWCFTYTGRRIGYCSEQKTTQCQ